MPGNVPKRRRRAAKEKRNRIWALFIEQKVEHRRTQSSSSSAGARWRLGKIYIAMEIGMKMVAAVFGCRCCCTKWKMWLKTAIRNKLLFLLWAAVRDSASLPSSSSSSSFSSSCSSWSRTTCLRLALSPLQLEIESFRSGPGPMERPFSHPPRTQCPHPLSAVH